MLMEEQYTSVDPAELVIDESSATCLKDTTNWTRFLAVCFCVFLGLMLFALMGLMVGKDLVSASLSRSASTAYLAKFGATVIIITLIIVICVMIYPTILLFRFSNDTKKGVLYKDQHSLEKGISAFKNYLIFFGILGMLSILSVFIQFIVFVL